MRIRSLLLAAAVTATTGIMAVALPASAQQSPPGQVLDRPLNGESAISALRDRLPEVAVRNRTTAAQLTALLRRDDTVWLDRSGLLHVKDKELPTAPTSSPEEGAFPTSDTFRLHSKPGAARTVFLDFDGHAVSGTAWNAGYGVATTVQPAFDTDGSPASWSQSEHDVVQSVHQRVAEDFAPFDVDVTTEDPGLEALHRSSTSDSTYGTRVLITPSVEARDKICGGTCGGVAYLGVFNRADNTYHQPAWVFAQAMLGVAKYIAEAASHEAGHNLGLEHDGTATEGYYEGHGNWAPIMGVGYSEPVVQWSRGEYPGANNAQDDVTVMQSYGLPLRGDDHGSAIDAARALGSGTSASGVVETRSDKDVFSVSRTCSGTATVTLRPAATSPNLDAKLRLLTSSGVVLAEDDPLSGRTDYDRATGLSAAVTAQLSAGTYYVEVDGVGAGDLTTGYSDYAAVGAYTVQISACSQTVPSVPTSVVVSKDDAAQSATIAWAPPQSDGGSAITGYRVARTGTASSPAWSTTVAATARSQVFPSLAAGSYTLSVEAVNAVGTGPAGSGTVTIGGSSTRTVTLSAVADTMARQQAATTASGSVTSLLADAEETAGNTATRATSYLRFTVPALAAGETITGASLSVQVTNGTTNGPAVWRTEPTWNESTLTWNAGQPARSGTAAVGNFPSLAAGRVSTPVSGITVAGEVSFQLHAESSDGLQFASRESTTTANRPQLVLTITKQ